MKTAAPILSLLLAVLILSSGLPLFTPEDVNRDQTIGLDDAILQVKNFAGTAEEPGTFAVRAERMLSTLHLVAGLNTVIKPAREAESVRAAFGLDLPYLLPAHNDFTPMVVQSALGEESSFYQSVVFTPSPPPPRTL